MANAKELIKYHTFAEDMDEEKEKFVIKIAKEAFDDPKVASSGKVFQVVASLIRRYCSFFICLGRCLCDKGYSSSSYPPRDISLTVKWIKITIAIGIVSLDETLALT
jgi:hypothetical protein